MSEEQELEQRVSKLENFINTFSPFLELTMSKVPPILAKIYLKEKMKEKKYLTWSDYSTDSEFSRIFQYPSKFYLYANTLAPLMNWKKKKIEGTLYYYEDGFDIGHIQSKARWKKFKPDDPKFPRWLIEEVIQPHGKINLFSYLVDQFPERGDNWRNAVIDNLKVYINRHPNCNIEFKLDNFWVKDSKNEPGGDS